MKFALIILLSLSSINSYALNWKLKKDPTSTKGVPLGTNEHKLKFGSINCLVGEPSVSDWEDMVIRSMECSKGKMRADTVAICSIKTKRGYGILSMSDGKDTALFSVTCEE